MRITSYIINYNEMSCYIPSLPIFSLMKITPHEFFIDYNASEKRFRKKSFFKCKSGIENIFFFLFVDVILARNPNHKGGLSKLERVSSCRFMNGASCKPGQLNTPLPLPLILGLTQARETLNSFT